MKVPSPKVLASISKLFDEAKSSKTMNRLFDKLDGATDAEAYRVICNLEDGEKRVLAVLIGKINEEFNRTK